MATWRLSPPPWALISKHMLRESNIVNSAEEESRKNRDHCNVPMVQMCLAKISDCWEVEAWTLAKGLHYPKQTLAFAIYWWTLLYKSYKTGWFSSVFHPESQFKHHCKEFKPVPPKAQLVCSLPSLPSLRGRKCAIAMSPVFHPLFN